MKPDRPAAGRGGEIPPTGRHSLVSPRMELVMRNVPLAVSLGIGSGGMLCLFGVGLLLSDEDSGVQTGPATHLPRPAFRLDSTAVPDPPVPEVSAETIRLRDHYGDPWHAQLKAQEYASGQSNFPANAIPCIDEALDPVEHPELRHWRFSGEVVGRERDAKPAIRMQWYSIFKGRADGWEEIETKITVAPEAGENGGKPKEQLLQIDSRAAELNR